MPRLLLVLAPLAALILVVGALAFGGGAGDPPPVATAQPSPVASAAAVASASPEPESPPVVAAGEEWIVYEAADGFVTLVRPDGSGRHRPLDNADLHQRTPDWSPDGSQLVFTRDDGSAGNLWVVNADGTGGRALTPAQAGCAPCLYQDWARWSPDGTAIVFVNSVVEAGRTIRNDLAIADVATGTLRTVATSDTQQFAVPSWSSDGSRIVVAVATYKTLATLATEGTLPESVELAIIDPAAAAPALEPIPGLPSYPGHPDWSPDGTKIVFRTNPYVNGALVDDGAGSAIYTVAPDGGDLVEVFSTPADGPILQATAWTPDGRRILHASRNTLDADPVLRILDPSDGSSSSATGDEPVYGNEPRLRPGP